MKHSIHRYEQYGKVIGTLTPMYRSNSTFTTMYDNATDSESPDETDGWLEYEEIPVMSGKQR